MRSISRPDTGGYSRPSRPLLLSERRGERGGVYRRDLRRIDLERACGRRRAGRPFLTSARRRPLLARRCRAPEPQPTVIDTVAVWVRAGSRVVSTNRNSPVSCVPLGSIFGFNVMGGPPG